MITNSKIKKKILKFNTIVFCLALYSYVRICVENKKFFFSKAKVGIICLNSKRFEADLQAISNQNKFEIIKLPTSLQQFLTSPYLRSINSNFPNVNKFEEFETNSQFKSEMYEAIEFCRKFIFFLNKFINFNTFLTCSIWYWHDKCWEIGAIKSNKNYLILHKECNKDPIVMNNFIRDYSKKKYKFYGTSILVYNELEKYCMVQSGVASSEKIIVVGNPRIDNLQNAKKRNATYKKNEITLFSFRHSIGGLKVDDEDGVPAFSKTRKEGVINYFDNIHGEFAKTALENPEIKFNIKIKWGKNSLWATKIIEAIEKYTGNKFINIKNLHIYGNEYDAQNLIFKSNVVVGINSTALLEAKILNSNVIIPITDEVKDKYMDRVYFQEYFNSDFIIVNSCEQLNQVTIQKLNYKNMQSITESCACRYFGFNDQYSSKRIIDFINDINYIH